MKATDVFVQCLENEGVEYIFGIVGRETIDLVDSISRSNQIKYVPVRHEQGAAFMAAVYGKLTDSPGVCTATLGPGATNLITGLACAMLDYSPVVAIAGQKGLDQQHKQTHQFLDLVDMMKPATKWSIQIKDGQTIPEIVRKAFQIALKEKPGSVFIELPENIAIGSVPSRVLPIVESTSNESSKASLDDALTALRNCNKPFIIAGERAIRQNAAEEVRKFAEQLQAPVTHSFTAKGVLPHGHPLNFYTFGFNENDLVLPELSKSDLLITIGFDCVESLPKDWNRGKVPVLHIDSLPAEVDEYYPVQYELIGHIKKSLQQMNSLDIPSKKWLPSNDIKEKIIEAYKLKRKDTVTALTIENIIHTVEDIATDETIIVSDVGAHKMAIARTFQPKRPGQLIISNGLASMGIGIPGSIGAKLAKPESPVICITGDGGALMTISELETAKRLGLSILIIILNDHTLKLEQETMEKKFGHSPGVKFGNPEFSMLAESFGIKGCKPESIPEFEQMLRSAHEANSELVIFDMHI